MDPNQETKKQEAPKPATALTHVDGVLVVSTSTRDDFEDFARLNKILKDRITAERDNNGKIISMAVSTLCLSFDGHKLSIDNIPPEKWEELHGAEFKGDILIKDGSLEEKPTKDGLGTVMVGSCQIAKANIKIRPKIEAQLSVS